MAASTPSTNTVKWQEVGLERVIPIAEGLLATARQYRSGGSSSEWERFLTVLTDRGEPRLVSAPLPRANVLNSQLLQIDAGHAVLSELVADHSARYFPRWHSVRWTESNITVKPIGETPALDTHQMLGIPVWNRCVWVSTCRSAFAAPWLLGIGVGEVGSVPQWRFTDVCAVCFSEPTVWNDQVFVALCVDWTRIELWTFGRDLIPLKLSEIASIDRKGTRAKDALGPVKMTCIGNTLYFIWNYYQHRVGKKKPRTWNARLFATGYELTTGVQHANVLAADDLKVVGATVEGRAFGNSVLVTYESRPPRNGGMRGFQFSGLEEVPCKPDVISLKAGPIFVIESSGVIMSSFQNNGTWIVSEQPPLGTTCKV